MSLRVLRRAARRAARRLRRRLPALATALVALGVTAALLAVVRAPAGATPAAAGRTWVVDAVDAPQQLWVAADTGTSEVRIAVGDTVEWQFDEAVQEHDLTSADTSSTWEPAVSEYRQAGGAPFRRTFDEPGVYDYLCSIHGTLMRGRVVVEDAANRPPTAAPVVDPRTGAAPLTVHFTANGSDPDGDALAYRWDFGTGDPAATSTENHAMWSYTEDGVHTATLEVSDGRGGVHHEEFTIAVSGDGETPVVSASATPGAGAAPLVVAFGGTAHDEQGGPLDHVWDFGDPSTTSDTATGPTAGWTYRTPGTYTATLTVTDADGHAGSDTVTVAVTDGAAHLPEVAASAAPRAGRAPFEVRLSTEVTTTGALHPFAAGTTTYPDLAGTAELVRRRGSTDAAIAVTGLKPGSAHLVHVHEQACSDGNGGAHFRFDETQPFAEENEIWLPFTSDAGGRSGSVEVARPQRAGPRAVSVVVHDPDNPANRIGCADLAPATADLVYAWDFGDGTTGAGADPDHTYRRPGVYTATVTVSSAHAGHGMGLDGSVSASVEVAVGDGPAPSTRIVAGPSGTVGSDRATFRLASSQVGSTFACRVDAGAWSPCRAGITLRGLRDRAHVLRARATGPSGGTDASPAVRRWTVDTTGPVVRGHRPSGTVRDRTPTVRAVVSDRLSPVRAQDLVLRFDGRAVDLRLRGGVVTWTPSRAPAVGRHTVRLVVRDAVGNRTARSWAFVVRR